MSVDSKTSALRAQAFELVKQHTVRDALGRIQFAFVAPIDAVEGTPCQVTEYFYAGTSTNVVSRQERKYAWKAAWDANFTFDPTVSYDPDGDGDL